MAFDALGILKGLYGGALIDMDESDAVAITKTANTDGNLVAEINGTPASGLTAVLVLTEAADADSYDDEALILIEASDYLDRNWEEVARFPVIHTHIAAVEVTATTAFVAADITAVMTQETTADTGQLLWFDPALLVIGGIGEVWIERDAAGDIFNEVAGKTLNSATTGASTKNGGAGTTRLFDMQPAIYTVRFHTAKKYVRCNCESIDDNMGKAWILLTDGAFKTL